MIIAPLKKGFMASRSFVRGYGKAIDLAGTKEWPKLSDGILMDYEALRGDWVNVGNTIRRETEKYAKSGICARQKRHS